MVSAHRLDETKWVQYDDFGWSLKGEIKDEEIVQGQLTGLNTLNNDDSFRYIKLIQEFNSILKK